MDKDMNIFKNSSRFSQVSLSQNFRFMPTFSVLFALMFHDTPNGRKLNLIFSFIRIIYNAVFELFDSKIVS